LKAPAGGPGEVAGRRAAVVGGLEFRLTDAVTLGGLVFLTLLAVAFVGRLDRPAATIGVNVLFIFLYIGSLAVLRRLRRGGFLRFAVRTAAVQLTFLEIYRTANNLQLVLFTWQDDRVLAWEQAVFGFQPVVAIQKLYAPPLTEWMFFVYVFYVLIYPLLGAIIYFRRGEAANEDYLFELGLVNFVCGLGFILFPVASPMYWEKVRSALTAPLTSGVFGQVAEAIRTHIHTAGGSLPSPHCAVATVMWFMAKRYTRRGFLLLAPVILSLYVSTVYGRFHYVSDAVAGIAAALLVILAAPSIERAWDRRRTELPGGAA
jgi:membrane-associated phospholipid phosphatase